MSMFDDVLGFGRTSVAESMEVDTLEPEIAGMSLEEAADIDEDPMDFMLSVAYENEMNMMNLNAAIVAEEYIYLRENGEEMVTEAGKIESIISRFKEGVQKLWAKIQSFFKTIINKIDGALKLDDRFLAKYEKKAAGKTGLVKGSSALLNLTAAKNAAKDMMTKIATESSNVFDKLSKDDTSTKMEDVMKNIANDLRLHYDGGGNVGVDASPKELMAAILKGYKPEDNAKPHQESADKAIEAFKASKGVKKDIKECYDENKKAINSQIKAAKKMESVAKKFKVLPTEQSRAIHGTVKILNKLGSILTLVNRTYVKVINMSRSYCKAVIVAAAAKSTEDVKKESASLIEAFEIM